ncbi:RNA polymerase sigma factor, sigma-70 family [Megamonas hypermegale]|uniref:RNA polymerase sigma factor, sigma-70 family n=1 Tax=Megamonas hypermegale TaxID=158847 RepID=A0A378NTG7_9FIRM|nr:hypothetical protein [Megamonas hypermegale]STY71095.1 RNA polymerase sigma factor, sigma-70 family [Megamonas hypermegale]
MAVEKEQETEQGFPEKIHEYIEIENLVLTYKKQFFSDATRKEIEESKSAATLLTIKFNPLFRKYIKLIKDNQLDFNDKDIKRFALNFIGDKSLKRALKLDRQSSKTRHEIYKKINFITETYGQLSTEEILIDLQMLLLVLAKRYMPMGRNFCAYLYNCFCYEVSRHIKKYIKNPANVQYKNIRYEDYMQTVEEPIEECLEDKMYENSMGMPDTTWINGITCSSQFQRLSPLERKILIKYYLEDYSDRQISELYCIHINTCNQKRRQATYKLAKELNINIKDIKRSRKSGKKALFYH